MPENFRDEETENRISNATEPDMENKTAMTHVDRRSDAVTSGVTDSDTESNISVTFGNEQTAITITDAMESDAKSSNSATSQDEQRYLSTIDVGDMDTESKITDTFDDDGSSIATSEDSDDGEETSPTQSDPPPPYQTFSILKPRKPPSFEADPVRYVLGMKLPIADSGFCACEFLTSSYATVFYVTFYASMLITDSFGVITPIVRCSYAYKFQLFLTTEEQYVVHAWTGVLLLISAFVLWLATFKRSRPMLIVWLLVMLVYVLMGLVVWLLGLLLSFAADGWNTHCTAALSAGIVDIGLEFYLLHMVYSFNRYMDEKPPNHDYHNPRVAALRQLELAQLGYREANFMGIPIVTPIVRPDADSAPPGPQVTSV